MLAARGRLVLSLGALSLVSACAKVSGLEPLLYDREPRGIDRAGAAGDGPSAGRSSSGGFSGTSGSGVGGEGGGGTGGEGGDSNIGPAGNGGQAGGGGEGPGALAPTVLTVTPTQGAVHVTEGQDIVVQFNEPMDRASTEAAYWQSGGAPELSWNADSTVLRVVSHLAYVETTDPDSTNAPVMFGFKPSARALNGEALGSAFTSAFSMYRRVTQLLPLYGDLTGRVYVDAGRIPEPAAGDTDTNMARRAVFTYVLDALPEVPQKDIGSAIVFEDAVIETSIQNLQGNPFVELGDAYINHVHFYSVLDGSAYDVAPLHELGIFVPASPQPVIGQTITKSVLVGLKDDFAKRTSRANHSQYRVQFPIDLITDQRNKSVTFNWGAVASNHLRVVYLFE